LPARFLAPKRRCLQGPRPRNPGIPTVSDWLLSRLTGLLEKRHYGGENGISLPGKEAADLMTTIRAYFTCDDAKIACLSQLDSGGWKGAELADKGGGDCGWRFIEACEIDGLNREKEKVKKK